MKKEKHTREAWFSLGREVVPQAKGETIKRVSPQGKTFYEKLFPWEDTRDAQEQVMQTPSVRELKEARKALKDQRERFQVTDEITEQQRKNIQQYVEQLDKERRKSS